MLDRKFILENVELVRQNCQRRGAKADLDAFVALETQRRAKQLEVEQLNRQANEVSKSIGQAKTPEEREARKAEGRQLREQTAAAQLAVDALLAESDVMVRAIPNLSHPQAPIGADDQANLEVRRGKTEPAKFSFKPLDHVELGERLELFDFEAGAKVTGHGF